MGCDIHLSVEYRHKKQRNQEWQVFGKPDLNWGRNYSLFSKMNKKVFEYNSESGFEERGLPFDTSFDTKLANALHVIDDEKLRVNSSVMRNDAERWVMTGISTYTNDANTFVTNPDWHSHSWLTYEEFQECVNECCVFDVYDIQWHVLVGAMEVLNANQFEVRVVFWFDN